VWQRQNASDQLTQDMLEFAESKFGEQVQVAWQDFNMTDLPVRFDAPNEDQIFMPIGGPETTTSSANT